MLRVIPHNSNGNSPLEGFWRTSWAERRRDAWAPKLFSSQSHSPEHAFLPLRFPALRPAQFALTSLDSK